MSIPDKIIFQKMPWGAITHNLSNSKIFPFVRLTPPSSFEKLYRFICGHGRVIVHVSHHRMNYLVLLNYGPMDLVLF